MKILPFAINEMHSNVVRMKRSSKPVEMELHGLLGALLRLTGGKEKEKIS